MKMTGQQIKRDICQRAGLAPKDVRVRWGKGTASFWLKIMIANTLYPTIGERVGSIVESSPEYGYGSYESDFSGNRNASVSVTNFDGLQMFWRNQPVANAEVDERRAHWLFEGF